MSDPFVGELRLFAGNFAPAGWALGNGQVLQINPNQALFALLGTTYGGDGRTTFGLPDLRGRASVHSGSLGGGDYQLGERGGAESVTLTVGQLPAHSHSVPVAAQPTTHDPSGAVLAASGHAAYTNQATTSFDGATLAAAPGGGQAHENMPPYLVLNYIIALQGIFPSQN